MKRPFLDEKIKVAKKPQPHRSKRATFEKVVIPAIGFGKGRMDKSIKPCGGL
jgi:hypothetical protein